MSEAQRKGGEARARKLTKEERRAIALKAAEARWSRIADPNRIPQASTSGVLTIGDVGLDVYVLEDRRRVIAKRAMARALLLKSEGGNAFMRTMSRQGIRSVLSQKSLEKIENPISFRPLKGDLADGYEAVVLIEVCDALIQARNEGKLGPNQGFLAQQAEIIVRSAAKVGIIALVDEATGYTDKVRDEYKRLFDAFIQDEVRQWEQEFPDRFFDMIYRVYGLKRQKPDTTKHPKFFAGFIRKYVYFPLANSQGAILEGLEEKNPVVYASGGRRYKLFQFLSDVVGTTALRQHLWQVTGIGAVSSNREAFQRNFYKAFPEATPLGHQWGLLDDMD
jgi:P63C domain